MHIVRHPPPAIRSLAALCGLIAFLGAYTIAFAQESLCTEVTHSNNAFGRSQ
jgi:hypothetical protein